MKRLSASTLALLIEPRHALLPAATSSRFPVLRLALIGVTS